MKLTITMTEEEIIDLCRKCIVAMYGPISSDPVLIVDTGRYGEDKATIKVVVEEDLT